LLFDFIAGREPEETPADAHAQGAVLARIHAEAADFATHHDRFILDLEHLLDRPLVGGSASVHGTRCSTSGSEMSGRGVAYAAR
jgi:Ser/Thr protein kinase RdoA (MazF antagonist)